MLYLGSVHGPEWLKRWSPPAFATIIFILVKRARRGALANMRHVIAPPHPWPVRLAALRMFSTFAHCLAETVEQYGPHPPPVRLELRQRDPLAEALQEGGGAILVTGHFGNWDIVANQLRNYGRPINVVMARESNVTTQRYVRQMREQAGVRIIYSDASVFSSLNIIRALQRNEIVAMQLDRPMGAGGTRSIPFFGVPASFPSGPFVLARLSGAPLIPVFIPRLGVRHYAIRVRGPFRLAREARDGRALERVMADVLAAFEEIIKKYPTQWFQFAPFWPAEAHATVAPSTEEVRLLARGRG